MVRQKGQDPGGGKKKPEGPEDRKNREGRDKAGGADSSGSGRML